MDRYLTKMRLGPDLVQPIDAPAYSSAALSNQPAAASSNDLSQQVELQAAEKRNQDARKRKRLDQELREQEEESRIRARLDELRVKAAAPIPRKDDGSIDQPMHTYSTKTRRMLYVEDIVSGVWPKQTRELCRWDLQPFSGTPIGIPRSFDKHARKFHLDGYFCSFSCAKSFIGHKSMDAKNNRTSEWLEQLARDFYGEYFHQKKIRAAPPRAKLSYYYAIFLKEAREDPMRAALREFRGDSEKMIIHPHPAPPFFRVTQAMDEEEIFERKEQQHQDRLALMDQGPRPIALTQRGMVEQRKYVLARRKPGKKSGAIGNLLGIKFVTRDDDEEE
jgi:hypothetical protein